MLLGRLNSPSPAENEESAVLRNINLYYHPNLTYFSPEKKADHYANPVQLHHANICAHWSGFCKLKTV